MLDFSVALNLNWSSCILGLNELFDESVKEEESEIGDNGDLGVRASVDVDRFLEDHREMMEEMEEAGIDLDAMVDLDALLEKYGG